jgi:hypothetical protein
MLAIVNACVPTTNYQYWCGILVENLLQCIEQLLGVDEVVNVAHSEMVHLMHVLE